MSTYFPLGRGLVGADAARLSLGMSAIVIGALSLLCLAVLVAIVVAVWELV